MGNKLKRKVLKNHALKPHLASTAVMRERIEARNAELCRCGHTRGNHYARSAWPGCSECTECRCFVGVSDASDR